MSGLVTLAALADDVLAAGGLPGGAMLSEAARRWTSRRIAQARAIWIEELRRGALDPIDIGQQDEVAAILFRYQRAAVEGAARLNLRLMAAVAAGQAASGAFVADEFLAWSESIAALRREEVILVVEMHRAERSVPPQLESQAADMWRLTGKWEAVHDAVIPDTFRDPDEVQATAAAAMRSGLVMSTGGTWDVPVTYVTTPRLARLVDLAPIEDAIGREGYHRRSRGS